jgi:hypothetical protein
VWKCLSPCSSNVSNFLHNFVTADEHVAFCSTLTDFPSMALTIYNGLKSLHFYFMLQSLGSRQRAGNSDSIEFYERRVIVSCGSINKVRQCALCNTKILRVWIPDSIMFLNWLRPIAWSGPVDQHPPLHSIVFESNSHLARIKSEAFSNSSL